MKKQNLCKKELQLKSSSPKILVIEDDVTSLKPILAILKNQGCEIFPCFSIYDAKEWLKQTPIDFMILDWFLPQNDGRETLRSLNEFLQNGQHKQHKQIPYVTYSGLEQVFLPIPNDEHFYYINHWKKPMAISTLTQKVLKLLCHLN